jgi:integrase
MSKPGSARCCALEAGHRPRPLPRLHAFYRWLEDEEDIPSPMAKMKPQAVPDRPIPVLGEPQLRSLFAVCAGKDFDARRDTALLMMLVDAGPRRAELLGSHERSQ